MSRCVYYKTLCHQGNHYKHLCIGLKNVSGTRDKKWYIVFVIDRRIWQLEVGNLEDH